MRLKTLAAFAALSLAAGTAYATAEMKDCCKDGKMECCKQNKDCCKEHAATHDQHQKHGQGDTHDQHKGHGAKAPN